VSPFGSPTSDTLRTAITDQTTKVLLFIISFDGVQGLIEDAKKAEALYTKYANGMNFSMEIVE
ncbi:MAG: B3/B4 domain-containing protein, partial [Turicibacter sp.]